MKSQRLLLAFAFGLGLALVVSFALTGRPSQAADGCNRYVVIDGSNSSDCSNPDVPCKTIQYALEWANTGERICVADRDDIEGPSTYQGTVVVTKSVILDGAWAAHPNALGWTFTSTRCNPENVIITGNGTTRVISITNASPTIRCFTITGGNAGGAVGDPNRGGGIAARDAAPIILGNIITGNYGCTTVACPGDGRGGGVYLINAPATAVISGNLIANNVADDTGVVGGGGIYLENASPQVLSNTIQTNRAGNSTGIGGGIAVESGAPLIADNDILTNVASLSGRGAGGGIFIGETSAVTVEYNLIQGNRAYSGATTSQVSQGGGIYYTRISGTIVIRGNMLRDNTAANHGPGQGGGAYLRYLASGDVVSGNTLHNNVASESVDGYGGGAYLDTCRATVEENAIFGNIGSLSATGYGGGLYVYKGAGLLQSNTITDNHAVINGSGFGGGAAIITSTVVLQDNRIADNRGAWAGQGMGGGVFAVDGAPQFVRNHVLNNEAGGSSVTTGAGGGFLLFATRPWLEGNVILDNVAAGGDQGRGGGVRLLSCPAFTLTNNIVARNDASAFGSGIAVLDSTGWIAHNTIAENLGGDGVGIGVGSGSAVGLINTIVASQTVGISHTGGSTVLAQYTLFDDNGSNYGSGVTSTNEIPGPAGLMPANYHLRSGSGAVDRAFFLAAVTTDVDGDPRPLGAAADVGADEGRFLYLPSVLRDC